MTRNGSRDAATRFLGVLEYDGTGFCGSQAQPGQRSVQGEVEGALERLNGEARPVLFAGRTDAGVHAGGQVVAIDLERTMSGVELAKALNGLMGRDVSVRGAVPVAASFHPRYWAVGRRYQYRVLRESNARLCAIGTCGTCPPGSTWKPCGWRQRL